MEGLHRYTDTPQHWVQNQGLRQDLAAHLDLMDQGVTRGNRLALAMILQMALAMVTTTLVKEPGEENTSYVTHRSMVLLNSHILVSQSLVGHPLVRSVLT